MPAFPWLDAAGAVGTRDGKVTVPTTELRGPQDLAWPLLLNLCLARLLHTHLFHVCKEFIGELYNCGKLKVGYVPPFSIFKCRLAKQTSRLGIFSRNYQLQVWLYCGEGERNSQPFSIYS